MGLDETINDELEATSKENGIDVHMILPKEYGAVAILSSSGYGNSGQLRDETNAQKRTTTGNATGVYFTGETGELLAGVNNCTEEKYYQGEEGDSKACTATLEWHGGRME